MKQSSITQTALPSTESRAWGLVYFASVSALGLFLVFALVRPLFVHLAGGGDHYVYLAHHLVGGDLTVDNLPEGYGDYAVWQGHKYLPFGLLPALLLVPFLPLLDAGLPLVSIGHLFTLLNIWLFYKVLGRAGVTGDRRKWALLLFFGGTVYSSTILVGYSGSSWLFAETVTVTFVLLAVWETLGKARPALIGLLLGLAGMARLTSVFALPFFVWMLWRGRPPAELGETPGTTADRPAVAAPVRAAMLLLGLAGPLLIVFAYNYARFSSPLESGYALALLYNPVLDQARSYGLFSVVHIPKNLFMMLLQGPVPFPSESAPVLQFPYVKPSPWGMGIFFTSPALAYAFRAKLREPFVRACWLAILSVMLPTITYYGVGWIQFGYRYALDFIPFLLLLAARGFPDSPTNWVRGLVIISVLVNLWGNFLISFGA